MNKPSIDSIMSEQAEAHQALVSIFADMIELIGTHDEYVTITLSETGSVGECRVRVSSFPGVRVVKTMDVEAAFILRRLLTAHNKHVLNRMLDRI